MFDPNNIYILTGAIQTGKTTKLMEWVASRNDVGGILTPDVNGLRKIFHISSGKYESFEIDEAENGQAFQIIGKFKFLKSAFNSGCESIKRDLENGLKWIIVDELGKLELREEGLEPYIQSIIKSPEVYASTKLLLVIRMQLLEQHIDRLSLINPTILSLESFEEAKLS